MRDMRDSTVEVEVLGEVFKFSTMDELTIDRHDLDEELASQAAWYAWFGVLCERARKARKEKEGELEELTAQIDGQIREEATAKKEKLTEAAIKQRIRAKLPIRKLEQDIGRLEYDERLIGVFHAAYAQRKDMLVSLARGRFFEMAGLPAAEQEAIKKKFLERQGKGGE